MTTDEGWAALEAAMAAFYDTAARVSKTDPLHQRMRAAIRAYLAALSDWRFVRTAEIDLAVSRLELEGFNTMAKRLADVEPAPGLEPDHE